MTEELARLRLIETAARDLLPTLESYSDDIDLIEADKQDLRNEVIEGAMRRRGDEVAEAIIAAAERIGRA